MKSTVVALSVVSAVALAVAFAYFKGRRYEIVITQSQIDAMLSERFSFSRRYFRTIEISYSDPVATLVPDSDRVRLEMKVDVTAQSKRASGSDLVATAIHYQPDTQQFFFPIRSS